MSQSDLFDNEAAEKQHERIQQYDQVTKSLRTLINICHGDSKSAGWWTNLENNQFRTFSYNDLMQGKKLKREHYDLLNEKLILIHSEISEGFEGMRKNLMDDKLPDKTCLEVELLDALIRILDLLGGLKMTGAEFTMFEKLEFNRIRDDHKIENRLKDNGKVM